MRRGTHSIFRKIGLWKSLALFLMISPIIFIILDFKYEFSLVFATSPPSSPPPRLPPLPVINCSTSIEICKIAQEFGCSFRYSDIPTAQGRAEYADTWMRKLGTSAQARMEFHRKNTKQTMFQSSAWDLCWSRQAYPVFAVMELQAWSPENIICKKDLIISNLKHYDDDIMLHYDKLKRDYVNKDYPANNKEKVRIAYLIMGKSDQISKITTLLRLIYSKDHYYVVHLDKKEGEDDWFPEFDTLKHSYPNLIVMNPRFIGSWGGISIVYIELASMILALNVGPWDFWINLSAADVPVIENELMVNYLSNWRDNNFMTAYKTKTPQQYANYERDELTYIAIACKDLKLPLNLRPNVTEAAESLLRIPPQIQWSICNTWVIFNRETVKFLVTDPFVGDLVVWSKYLYIPEEKILQTAVINKFPASIILDYKRYVNWSSPTGINLNKVDIDILKTAESTKYFFARKMMDDDIMKYYLDWWEGGGNEE